MKKFLFIYFLLPVLGWGQDYKVYTDSLHTKGFIVYNHKFVGYYTYSQAVSIRDSINHTTNEWRLPSCQEMQYLYIQLFGTSQPKTDYTQRRDWSLKCSDPNYLGLTPGEYWSGKKFIKFDRVIPVKLQYDSNGHVISNPNQSLRPTTVKDSVPYVASLRQQYNYGVPNPPGMCGLDQARASFILVKSFQN